MVVLTHVLAYVFSVAVYHQLRNITELLLSGRCTFLSRILLPIQCAVYVVAEPCAITLCATQIGLHTPEHTQTFAVISGPWHVGTLQGAQGREFLIISCGIYLRRI